MFFSSDSTNRPTFSEQPLAPGLGAYSSPQRGETQRDTEVLCSALPPVAVGPLAPQAPGHPPEANLEFPGQKEEPPSSLEAGGSGFPGILLHNGPAVSRKALWDGHWAPLRLRWGHQTLQSATPWGTSPVLAAPSPLPISPFVSSKVCTLSWTEVAGTLVLFSGPRCLALLDRALHRGGLTSRSTTA